MKKRLATKHAHSPPIRADAKPERIRLNDETSRATLKRKKTEVTQTQKALRRSECPE